MGIWQNIRSRSAASSAPPPDVQLPITDVQVPATEAPEAAPKPQRSRLPWVPRILAAILLLFFLLIGWLAITAPLSKSLQPISPPQITLLAADGTPIARNGAIVEAPVEAQKLPDHVVNAFIAIEDRRFYDHWGVDPRGIARAAWTGVGGGSTITQQLAKFTFLTPEQTLSRKAREMLIAFWLEAWLTKDEVLERYLSNAYFGDRNVNLASCWVIVLPPWVRPVVRLLQNARAMPRGSMPQCE